MPRYMVRGERRGINIQWIAERADDDADAVEQFRKKYRDCRPNVVASPLDPIPGTMPDSEPEPVISPPEAAAVVSSRTEHVAPAGSITEPVPAEKPRGPVAKQPDVESPEPAPMEVGILENYGVKPNDIAELYAFNLRTVEAVEQYAQQHGGLTTVHGIGPVGEQQIRDGIAAWRQTSKI